MPWVSKPKRRYGVFTIDAAAIRSNWIQGPRPTVQRRVTGWRPRTPALQRRPRYTV